MYFRYLLLALNFAGGLLALLAVRALGGEDAVYALCIGGILTLNFIYLLQAPAASTRLFRIASLWLDAKEADLKNRATAAGSPHNVTSASSQRRN